MILIQNTEFQIRDVSFGRFLPSKMRTENAENRCENISWNFQVGFTRVLIMMITFIRTFIVYAVALFTIRCMGKTGLSSTDPFQITIMLLIAELAAMPVSSPEISLLNGVAAIFMILFLYALSGFLSRKSEWFKKFITYWSRSRRTYTRHRSL